MNLGIEKFNTKRIQLGLILFNELDYYCHLVRAGHLPDPLLRHYVDDQMGLWKEAFTTSYSDWIAVGGLAEFKHHVGISTPGPEAA